MNEQMNMVARAVLSVAREALQDVPLDEMRGLISKLDSFLRNLYNEEQPAWNRIRCEDSGHPNPGTNRMFLHCVLSGDAGNPSKDFEYLIEILAKQQIVCVVKQRAGNRTDWGKKSFRFDLGSFNVQDAFKKVSAFIAKDPWRENFIGWLKYEKEHDTPSQDMKTAPAETPSGKLTVEEVEGRLRALGVPRDQKEGPTVEGKWVTMSYRCWRCFQPREGEEDDDSPDFVLYDKVAKIVKEHFADWIAAKKVTVDLSEDEKYWYHVAVSIL